MVVSVVLPAYNMGCYIVDCLNSIINQIDISYSDYEVIVVNDGSSDDTLTKVQQFITTHKDADIKIVDKRNEGVSIARNVGLNMSVGEYVWFIDPDDRISNDAFKYIKQVVSGQKPDLLVIGKVIRNVLKSDGTFKCHTIRNRKVTEGKIIPAYKLYSTKEGFNHQRFIWNRFFLTSHNLHYPEYISQNEDFFFSIKSLYLAKDAYINTTFDFYYYRSDIESASRISDKYERIDKLMRNRILILSELEKIYKTTISSTIERDIYFNYKFVELQTNATVTLLISGAPLYLVRYYLNKLKKLHSYPMNSEMLKRTNYYYRVFNFKPIYYMVSQFFRLPIIEVLRKFK